MTGVNKGFLFLLHFPHVIKKKVSGDSKQNRSSMGIDFPKLKNQLTFFINSESCQLIAGRVHRFIMLKYDNNNEVKPL